MLFFSFSKPEKKPCNCLSHGSFLKVSKYTQLVIVGKVKAYTHFKYIQGQRTPVGMDVEIIDQLKGNYTAKTVRIWGDNGALCRPFLSSFPLNKTFVFALDPGNPQSGNIGEKKTDYFVSICGEFSCVADPKAKMIIYGNGQDREQISYEDLKTYWSQN